MATLVSSNPVRSDADLVAASRGGDRAAFGQIVRRYQGIVSGLIYAACGDLHRSEDVAQETFISAWKSLSGLRDPSKLAGWLCQIARRRLADVLRKTSGREIQFGDTPLPDQMPVAAVGAGAEVAEAAEESEMLWRTLSRIPQPYRETLVLYYRQEQSTAQVAAVMETTEAAVRQRLTRGRQILRDEVEAVLERNLALTAPTPRFTAMVVAALPALGAQTAGLGATAKGAAALKGGGMLASVLAWATPVTLFGAMVFGTVQDVRLSKSRRQRWCNIVQGALMWIVIGVWVVALNRLASATKTRGWDAATMTSAYAVSAAVFGFALFSVTVFMRWWLEGVLREDGVKEPPFPTITLWQRLFFTLPVVAICLGWMVRLAMGVHDTLSVDLIVAIIIVQGLWYAWRLPHLQPEQPIQQTFETFTLVLVAAVGMVNWRLPRWLGDAALPLSTVNVAAAILFGWMVMLWGINLGRIRRRASGSR